MKIALIEAGSRREADVNPGQMLLDVLQDLNISVSAACGGRGTCGKCQVLVRDERGLGYRLACKTSVSEGMEVVLEQPKPLVVSQEGQSGVFPPDVDAAGVGIAVDLGTTSLVAHMHDLRSGERLATVVRANPQMVFGSDVISRISASVDGKLQAMTSAIVDALCEMKEQLCGAAGVEANQVMRIVIAGNTVMQHIVAGLAPDSMGKSPFAPQSLFGDERIVGGLGRCCFARCIAGFVGGDVVCDLLSCGIDGSEARLLIDLGTNGEMALAARGRITCCATAAGPVFEGAGIRFGMPALPGAISRVGFEDGGLVLETVGGADPIGICGTGVVDAVATMLRLGIVDETGRMLGLDEVDESLSHLVGREGDCNVFYLMGDRSVYLTQQDVRNVQLAKAAICAGVFVLADHVGIGIDGIRRVDIAGGFGSWLNLESAAAIGLFPGELLSRAHAVGNTAGEGAACLAVSEQARRREVEIVARCDYLELSTSPEFDEVYIDQLEFSA